MKKKRSMRHKILLDQLDMNIMKRIKTKPQGIMELNEAMGMRHPKLKAHLDRLSASKLISKTRIPKSRKILLSIPKEKRLKAIFQTFG